MENLIYNLLPNFGNMGVWAYWTMLIIGMLESLPVISIIVPGSFILMIVGFLATEGTLHVVDLIWFSSLGAILGDSIGYYLGKYRNSKILQISNRFFGVTYIEKADKYFQGHGGKSVFIGRFIGILRPFVAFVAGMHRMKYTRFLFFNITSGFLWSSIFILLGYYFGDQIKKILSLVNISGYVFIASVGIAVFVLFLWKKYRNKANKTQSMRKIILYGSAVGVIALIPPLFYETGNILKHQIKNESQTLSVQTPSDLPKGEIKEYKVEYGDTFAEVMSRMGVPYDEALAIMNSSKDVFDFTKINAGKLLKLVFVNQAFAAMEYTLSSDTVIHVKKQDDQFKVTEEEIPYVVEVVTVKGVIKDSLFATAAEAGVEDKITLKLADIFSWDIDFATDIREGDSFSIVYEKRSLDGKPVAAGRLLAAKFTNSGKEYSGFRYKDAFYDSQGVSLARQFVRSPLSYSYISSGYANYRVNPVTRKVETHFAIDYAASAGTPVIATAKGGVVYAANKGGLGTTVELQHGGGYKTQYAHLSKIAKGVKNGGAVEQGDVIGYVGSTGISTGPHLQYAMYKNGEKVNPLTIDTPTGEFVEGSQINEFNAVKNKYQALLP